MRPNYFKDWDKSIRSRELLPHEYVHSWNGKFRRPSDLWTPQYNVPMRNSLLWVYEGMTQYWGHVLAARAGLSTPEQARDRLAAHNVLADLDDGMGRLADMLHQQHRHARWIGQAADATVGRGLLARGRMHAALKGLAPELVEELHVRSLNFAARYPHGLQ